MFWITQYVDIYTYLTCMLAYLSTLNCGPLRGPMGDEEIRHAYHSQPLTDECMTPCRYPDLPPRNLYTAVRLTRLNQWEAPLSLQPRTLPPRTIGCAHPHESLLSASTPPPQKKKLLYRRVGDGKASENGEVPVLSPQEYPRIRTLQGGNYR